MDTFRIVVIENTCPVCRRGKIYASFLSMNERCPECGTLFLPEGSWTGATVLAYVMGSAIGAVALFLLWATGNLVRGAEFGVVAVIWVSVTLLYRYLKAWWVALLFDSGFVHGGKIAATVSPADLRARDARFSALLLAHPVQASPEAVEACRREIVEKLRVEKGLRIGEAAPLKPEEARELEVMADQAARLEVLLQRIADQQGIEVTEADLRGRFEEISSQKGKPLDWVFAAYSAEPMLGPLRRRLLLDKTIAWVMDHPDFVGIGGQPGGLPGGVG